MAYQIDYVDLYETRSVRRGNVSYQEWKHLARGMLDISSQKCFFAGGGESRTFDRSKIIHIVYFTDTPGIEVSLSNRQKSMRFMLPGRTIADGKRLLDAIVNGETNVILTNPVIQQEGCYIATFVYGSYDSDEVLVLRKFRDQILLKRKLGRLFVRIYYGVSPFLVSHFGNSILKKLFKVILDKFVNFLTYRN